METEELSFVLYKDITDEYEFIAYMPFFELDGHYRYEEIYDVQKLLIEMNYVILSVRAPYIHCRKVEDQNGE